jgi:hypothetical protein
LGFLLDFDDAALFEDTVLEDGVFDDTVFFFFFFTVEVVCADGVFAPDTTGAAPIRSTAPK